MEAGPCQGIGSVLGMGRRRLEVMQQREFLGRRSKETRFSETSMTITGIRTPLIR